MNESASDSARASANLSGNKASGERIAEVAAAAPAERAYRSSAAWLRFLVPAALGLAGDLLLKQWAFPEGVPPESLGRDFAVPTGRHPVVLDPQAWPVIPKILGFTTTVNEGAVFGKFQGHVSLFLGFSLVAMAIIIWVFATSGRKQWLVHIALGLIAAGALGNMYDRAVFHGVRDMLRFYVNWYPYIFNLADVLLCVGVPLLIVRWMFTKEPGKA
jgi:signal peptidase II